MSFRTLKNISALPASCVFGGKQHVLQAKDEQNFDAALATAFLEANPGTVVDNTEAIGALYEAPDATETHMWLANVTGNPDAPAKVSTTTYNDRFVPVKVDIDNPIKELNDLTWEFKGGQKQWIGRDGTMWQMALGGSTTTLPARRRIRVTQAQGEQILGRAGRASLKNAVIRSRAPTTFEPDASWEFNDIRSYLKLIDPNANIGPTEESIQENLEHGEDFEQKLYNAKRDLLVRTYYRVCDPKYRLPTRAEFKQFTTGKSEQALTKESVQELLRESDKNAAALARKKS